MTMKEISKELRWDPDNCKLCGLCVKFCPQQGLEIKDGKLVKKEGVDCIRCGFCEKYCPDMGLEIVK